MLRASLGLWPRQGLSSPLAGEGAEHGFGPQKCQQEGMCQPCKALLEERCAKGPRHGAAPSHPLQQAGLWGG